MVSKNYLPTIITLISTSQFAMGASIAFQQEVQNLSPFAYYEFEEIGNVGVYADSSGNNNDIVVITGTSAGVAGFQGGRAISFDGGNDSLVAPFNFDPSSSAWSIELVLATDSPFNPTQVIIANKNGSGTGRSNVLIGPDGVYGSFINGTSSPKGGMASPFEFQHLVVTYDGAGLMSIYHEGSLQSTVMETPEAADGAWVIGTNKNQNIQFWAGDLDDLAFYDFALSASQIDTNYRSLSVPEPSHGVLICCALFGTIFRRRG